MTAREKVSEHAAEDLIPARLLRELDLCEREYGTDRIAGVPIARIPAGLLERVQIALRLRTSQEWQPIESAPNDVEVFIGAWIDGQWKFGPSVRYYECGNEMEGENYKGWFWSIDDVSESVAEAPSHWHPLISPPPKGEAP